MTTERATIIRNKLCIISEGGSVTPLGIRGFKALIAQIEASKLSLKDSTKARLSILKDGVKMWENRT